MATQVERKAGPSLAVGLVTLAVGILLAVPSFVIVVVRAVQTITSSSASTPLTQHRHLSSGRWTVFQLTGTSTGIGGVDVTGNNANPLQPSDVVVTAPDGSTLDVSEVTVVETITHGSRVFTGALQFDVPQAGTYTISIQAPGDEVIITRSLGAAVRSLVAPALLGTAGGLIVVLGIVLLIVGAVRRRPKPAYAPVTPAAWYPDPSGSGRLRWWDGARWTDHLS